MSAISTRYSESERLAMGGAMANGMPARQVIEHAAAGTLELDGVPLPPFEITSESTVRDQAARYKRRRASEARSELADAPPRDAIEALRQELVAMAESEVKAMKRQKNGTRDLERLRQAIRCVREAAAIPGRDEPRPVAPGQRDANGQHNGGRTQGGIGGQILKSHYRTDHDPTPEPAAQPKPEPEPEPESFSEAEQAWRAHLAALETKAAAAERAEQAPSSEVEKSEAASGATPPGRRSVRYNRRLGGWIDADGADASSL
jgi:hypothetical protein